MNVCGRGGDIKSENIFYKGKCIDSFLFSVINFVLLYLTNKYFTQFYSLNTISTLVEIVVCEEEDIVF